MNQTSECIISHPSLAGIDNFLSESGDLVCLSHLRWDVAYQQPHHLLNYCQQKRRVFFVEEPVVEGIASWWVEVTQQDCGVWVVVPHLPNWINRELVAAMHQSLMDELFETYAIADPILWYHTPVALSFTKHLPASAIVYECIDEPSPLQGASPALQALEQELLQRADVVFTGGQSLYETQQRLHLNVRVLPSSTTDAQRSAPLSGSHRN